MLSRHLSGILSFAALAASFVAISRLYEGMSVFRYPNDASFFGLGRGSRKACAAVSGSLLHSLAQSKRSSLFIVLDGYPEPGTYRSVTGSPSILHSELSKKSSVGVASNTYIDNTAYSLAYILAGSGKPRWFCRYPVLDVRPRLNLLAANQYFSSSSSFCRDYLPFGWSFLQKVLNGYGLGAASVIRPAPYLFSVPRSCTLMDASFHRRILAKLKAVYEPGVPAAHIFHEVFWHDFALMHKIMNLNGDQYARGLVSVDRRYAANLSSIIAAVKVGGIVDDLFILSDHGPRVLLAKGQARPVAQVPLTRDKGVLRNYYGFFVYYVPIKSGDNQLIRAALDRLASAKPSMYYEINRLGFPVGSPSFRP